MRISAVSFFLICFFLIYGLALTSAAQQATPPSEVFCSFADGKTIKVQYVAPTKSGEFHEGRIWEPGGSPMILFTQAALKAGGTEIPDGAYSLYILPAKQKWTLVVNKNVVAKSKYDPKQDLVRLPMESAVIDTPLKQLNVAFAHIAPQQCNLRLYYEKTGAWAEFHEKQ
jgi:hypothetical protein